MNQIDPHNPPLVMPGQCENAWAGIASALGYLVFVVVTSWGYPRSIAIHMLVVGAVLLAWVCVLVGQRSRDGEVSRMQSDQLTQEINRLRGMPR